MVTCKCNLFVVVFIFVKLGLRPALAYTRSVFLRHSTPPSLSIPFVSFDQIVLTLKFNQVTPEPPPYRGMYPRADQDIAADLLHLLSILHGWHLAILLCVTQLREAQVQVEVGIIDILPLVLQIIVFLTLALLQATWPFSPDMGRTWFGVYFFYYEVSVGYLVVAIGLLVSLILQVETKLRTKPLLQVEDDGAHNRVAVPQETETDNQAAV